MKPIYYYLVSIIVVILIVILLKFLKNTLQKENAEKVIETETAVKEEIISDIISDKIPLVADKTTYRHDLENASFILTPINDEHYKYALLYTGNLTAIKEFLNSHTVFPKNIFAELLIDHSKGVYMPNLDERFTAVCVYFGEINWKKDGYWTKPEQDTLNFLTQYSKRILMDTSIEGA